MVVWQCVVCGFFVIRQFPGRVEIQKTPIARERLNGGLVFEPPVQTKIRVVQTFLGAVLAREVLRYVEPIRGRVFDGLAVFGERGLHVYAVGQLVRGQSGIGTERGRANDADERFGVLATVVGRIAMTVQVRSVHVRGVAKLAFHHQHHVDFVFHRIVVFVRLDRVVDELLEIGRHEAARCAIVAPLRRGLGRSVRFDMRPEPGCAAQVLAANVALKRLDVHVRDLVFFERGPVQERLVARLAREVPGPVVVPPVDVQAHGRLESAAAHLANRLVVQLVPEPNVIVQVIFVVELGQTQVTVQVHELVFRVLVELQVERVAHF